MMARYEWRSDGLPYGHMSYCHNPGSHNAVTTWCTDPTGTGERSPQWVADHPQGQGPRVVYSQQAVTRESQIPEVIYVREDERTGALQVFVTPDGIGRYWFDSVEEAIAEMIGGEEFPIVHVDEVDE